LELFCFIFKTGMLTIDIGSIGSSSNSTNKNNSRRTMTIGMNPIGSISTSGAVYA
jgi:hypothetical protein